jgi:hypothetical protein
MTAPVNDEGLTFAEWIQAAGRFKPMGPSFPGSHVEPDCAPMSWFPRRLRRAWREGQDPTDWISSAPGRRTDIFASS